MTGIGSTSPVEMVAHLLSRRASSLAFQLSSPLSLLFLITERCTERSPPMAFQGRLACGSRTARHGDHRTRFVPEEGPRHCYATLPRNIPMHPSHSRELQLFSTTALSLTTFPFQTP